MFHTAASTKGQTIVTVKYATEAVECFESLASCVNREGEADRIVSHMLDHHASHGLEVISVSMRRTETLTITKVPNRYARIAS